VSESDRERGRRNPVGVVVAVTLIGVLAAAATFMMVVVLPSFEARAIERCTELLVEAGGDSAGVNQTALMPPQWTCSFTDEGGRTQRVELRIGDLGD